MFRTKANVPEFYVNHSRDFQLLCNLKDVVFNGVKYNIDSIRHTANTTEMNNKLLHLLKSKVGFFSDFDIPEDQLRIILAAFPYLIKNKGSIKGIKYAIYTWFRLTRSSGQLMSIITDNTDYTITINVNTYPKDLDILNELLRYIIPTGYLINYNFGQNYSFEDVFDFTDRISVATMPKKLNNRIQTEEIYDYDPLLSRVIGSVGLTQIATKSDLNIQEANTQEGT